MPVKAIVYGQGVFKNSNAFKDISSRLELVKERLKDPQPALNSIVAEFGMMEARRFMSGGYAPEFGIKTFWSSLSEGYGYGSNWSTYSERAVKGGNPSDTALLNFGYLAKAASDPNLKYVGTKAIEMTIDPNREAPGGYSHNHNYGAVHQLGLGNNPKRQFVTIRPTFIAIANRIIKFYVLEGTAKEQKRENVKIPSNSYRTDALKRDLRKFENKIKKRNPNEEFRPFGHPMDIHYGRGHKIGSEQTKLLGGKTLGKRTR